MIEALTQASFSDRLPDCEKKFPIIFLFAKDHLVQKPTSKWEIVQLTCNLDLVVLSCKMNIFTDLLCLVESKAG